MAPQASPSPSTASDRPPGYLELAVDGTVRMANPAAAHLLNAPEGVIGTSWTLADFLRDDSPLPGQIAEMGQGGREGLHQRVQLLPFGGGARPVDVAATLVHGEGGSPARISVVLTVAEEPEQQQVRSQQYFDVARVMLLVLDTEGQVQEINPHGCVLLGCDRDEIVGLDWFAHFLPPELRETIAGTFRRILAGESSMDEYFEHQLLTHGGERRLLAFRNALLRDDDGRIEGILVSGEDITDRRAAEQARDDLIAILEAAPEAIGLADASGNALYRNAGWEALTGTDARELHHNIQDDLEAFFPPWAQRTVREQAFPQAAKEGLWQGEAAVWDAAGNETPVSMTVVAHKDAAGAVLRYSTNLHDLSRIKEAEHFNRLLLESLGEGVFGVDRAGRFTFLNPEALRLFGFGAEDAVLGADSHALTHHTHPSGAPFPAEECPIYRVMESGQPLEAWEDRFFRADGSAFPTEVFAAPVRGPQGDIQGAVVSFEDISRRKASEAERDRLVQILEATPDLIAMADCNGQPFYYNPAGLALLGVDSLEAACNEHIAARHPDWAWRRLVEEGFPAAERTGRWQGEMAFRDRAGQEIPVSQVVLAIRDEAGAIAYYATVMRDLTAQKEREGNLRLLTEVLEATPDFVSFARTDGTVLYVNQGGRKLVGLPPSPSGVGDALPADIQSEKIAGQWGHPDWAGQKIRSEGIPTAMEQGQWEGETALLDAEGNEIPASQVILSHRDEHGEITRLSTIMRDIRPQKELENRLRRRQQALQSLHDITADPDRDLDAKLHDLLALGAAYFELPYAIVSRVKGQTYEIRQAVSPDGSLAPGQQFDLGLTYCTHTIGAGGPLGFYHVAESAIRDHPCYRTQGLEAYLGVPVRVGNQVDGTLNFSRPEPRAPYSDFEWELLKIMGQWVSYELTREANREALERERSLFIGGPTVVFQWAPNAARTVTYVSPNVADNFGYTPESLLGRSFSDLIRPADQRRVLAEAHTKAENGVDSYEQEYRLVAGDGEERWVRDFTVANRDAYGNVESYQGYLLDITARRQLEAEQRLLATAFHTSQALLITDAKGTIERVNPAFTEITGYAPEEVIGANPRILASGIQGADFYQAMWHRLQEADQWEGEIWNRRRNGEIYPEWESISAVRDEQGRVEHYVAVFHEISEQKRLESELERLATHDRLTGIYNRTKLYELLDNAQSERARYATPFSVIMFDIDHFKAINDHYGHTIGDAALRELTLQVGSILRETDHFGRWGGEEFLILATHTRQAEAVRLAERIRAAVANTVFEQVGAITVSLGVAEIQPADNLDHLEERADEALYAAKAAGRNRVVEAPDATAG